MNDARWALGTHESWGALLPGCKLVLCRRGALWASRDSCARVDAGAAAGSARRPGVGCKGAVGPVGERVRSTAARRHRACSSQLLKTALDNIAGFVSD